MQDLSKLTVPELRDLRDKVENEYYYEDAYREALNELAPVQIGTLKYDTAEVLEQIDPIAYRCGLLDYADELITEAQDAIDAELASRSKS